MFICLFRDLGWGFSASSQFVALWALLGSRGDKGCLTSTCPHAGFYRVSIYRSVKHSIIDTSELIQAFLAICCSCLLLRVLNLSCLRTRAVAEHGWQELELNPLSLPDSKVKLPLGRASLVSSTFPPHLHLPTTGLPLSRAGSGCCLLELCKQEPAHRHFHCCKSDLEFGGNLCAQLSESRMISGKPVIYSTNLGGFCFLSASKF